MRYPSGRVRPLRASFFFALIATLSAPLQGHADKRAVRLDDLAAEEQIGFAKDWSIACDGALALPIERAPNTRRSWRVQGADVWVQLAAGQPLKPITDGRTDDSDWRNPLWSPDGSRLIAVSTRGGTRSLWLWERTSGALRPLTQRSIGNGGANGDGKVFYEWVDDTHLVAAVLPQGERPKVPGLDELEPMAQAKAVWARFLAGESSVSVLETGRVRSARQTAPVEQAVPAEDLRQIVRIDVATGKSVNLTDTYRPAVLNLFAPRLSGDGRFIAVWIYGPPVSNAMNDTHGTLSVLIRRVDGGPSALDRPLPGDILRGSAVWSPDATQLAYFAFGSSRERAPKLVRVDAVRGRVRERDLGDVIVADIRDDNHDFARLEWTESAELVFLAGRGEEALKKYARRDWWLIPQTGEPLNLTAHLDKVPEFHRLSNSGPLVGLADDILWKLEAARRSIQPLTQPGALPRARIVWPQSEKAAYMWAIGRNYFIRREERPASGAVVIKSIDPQLRESFTKIEMSTRRVIPLTAPEPELSLARLSPQGDKAYWARGFGTAAWRTTADASAGRAEKFVSLNEWQANIIAPPDTAIHYTSLNGDSYSAWVKLPVGYRKDRRYPLIADIYPGEEVKSYANEPLYRLASAVGFAILKPQMGPKDSKKRYGMYTRDPYFEVPNGVLPAVQKAVELGIADPDRLFVEGWSMGGFATYAIVEQTARFKAALAGVGISDWTSGVFSSRGRYGEDVERLNIGWEGENVQQRPATETQWSDLGLFQRNSPIIYAERVRTPLLIVHSDLDGNVPMSHSEEMFGAMVQLNKRANFVRYWGEGHGIYNPANVRDLWQRRLAWFDEFGDIKRDARGQLVFDGERVQSRGGAPALAPGDYAAFDLFQPGGR